MARWNHRRRRRRFARVVMFAVVLLLVVQGMSAAGAAGNPFWGLVFFPVTLLSAVVALPFVVLGMLLSLLALAIPLVVLTAIFGGPLYVLYRVLRSERGTVAGSRRERRMEVDAPLSPDARLRRRYVAGELTYQQFQAEMVTLLKERYTRGDLTLSAYEAELDDLLKRARRLDVNRDPDLADDLRRH
ncbi:MAG: hypothetical protein HY332_16580 [Chloroflexi bacterium]|nr:hypothetical protein [Chloroflexota bacterium]